MMEKLERLIDDLEFLADTLLAEQPEINSVFEMLSKHRNMNIAPYHRAKNMDANTRKRNILLFLCTVAVQDTLFTVNRDVYQNITDDQMNSLIEFMSFFLQQHNSNEGEITMFRRSGCIKVILQLIVVLLTSNKRPECEAWITEHSVELMSLTADRGNSILHLALDISVNSFPRAPFVRMLVKGFKIDVNVQNVRRETPLHLLSKKIQSLVQNKLPSDDIMGVAELLINNGAHMDAVDVNGQEASHAFSRKFPQWSFNFKLSCLAARAIVKHGVRSDRKLPATIVSLIQSHKPGKLKE